MRRLLSLVLAAACLHSSWGAEPEPKRASESGPSIKGRAAGETKKNQGAAIKEPLSVRIVESEEDASDRKKREQHSQQREDKDLIAQEAAASAAQAQVGIARWTVVLSSIGTIGLFATVVLSYLGVRQATRAAEAANQSAKAAEASASSIMNLERAYVFAEVLPRIPTGARFRHSASDQGAKNVIQIKFQNLGNTPASVVRIDASVVFGESIPSTLPIDRPKDGLPMPIGIAKDGTHQSRALFRLHTDTYESIATGKARAFCVGAIAYLDVFSNGQSTGFCWEVKFSNGDDVRFVPVKSSLNYRT